MGVQLSWESTCLASRGSRVRISPSPLPENLTKTSRQAKFEFSRRHTNALSEYKSKTKYELSSWLSRKLNENERKRSLNLVVAISTPLISTSRRRSANLVVDIAKRNLVNTSRRRSMNLVVGQGEKLNENEFYLSPFPYLENHISDNDLKYLSVSFIL